MVDFIENIINPPEDINEKQVWRLLNTDDDALVLDAKYKSDGIVKVVLFSRTTELNDGYDVKIPGSGDDASLFPGDRIALRITESYIPMKELLFFRGTINDEIFDKIRRSLKQRTPDYNEVQERLLEDILKRIESIKEPVNQVQKKKQEEETTIEESNKKIPVLHISQHRQESAGEVYEYKWVADDTKQLEKLREFWKKERKLSGRAISFNIMPDLELRINIINGVLYVMFFSLSIARIENIQIAQGDTFINAKNTELNLINENRAFTSFDPSSLIGGKCILQFTVEGKSNSFEFIVR